MLNALADMYEQWGRPPQRGGMLHPVLLRPGDIRLRRAGPDPSVLDEDTCRAGELELQRWLSGSADISNEPTAVFAGWDDDTLLWRPGTYFDLIRTCEPLAVEARQAHRHDLPSLPLRTRAHEQAGGDPVCCGDGRSAALTACGLLRVHCDEGRFVLLARRDATAGENAGLWDTLPSVVARPEPEGVCAPALDVLRGVSEAVPRVLVRGGEPDVRMLGCGFSLLDLRWHLIYAVDVHAGSVDEALGWLNASDRYDHACAIALTRPGASMFWQQKHPTEMTRAAVTAVCLAELDAGLT